MRPLKICIGPTIRIGRESWCLPYAGFFSAELKKLDRYVKKEYRQKGKSTKYLRLKTADDSKYRKAAAFY